MRKFKTWEYAADTTGLREYSHDVFQESASYCKRSKVNCMITSQVFYDRIPFKLDDFISHLFTEAPVFLSHYQDISWYKMGIKLEDLSSYASDRK